MLCNDCKQRLVLVWQLSDCDMRPVSFVWLVHDTNPCASPTADRFEGAHVAKGKPISGFHPQCRRCSRGGELIRLRAIEKLDPCRREKRFPRATLKCGRKTSPDRSVLIIDHELLACDESKDMVVIGNIFHRRANQWAGSYGPITALNRLSAVRPAPLSSPSPTLCATVHAISSPAKHSMVRVPIGSVHPTSTLT
jgi:hypothetical protein